MMSHKKFLAAAVAVVLGGSAGSVWAASPQTTSFQVTATVINDCIISSSNIAFGNYDPTVTTASTATGAVTATCTKGDSVTVALDQGKYPATTSTAAVPARRMQLGTTGSYLPYDIYIASGGTTEWGTGTVGTNEPPAQLSASVKTALTFTTYGSIAAGIDVAAGSYTDTVTATVSF